MFYFYQQCIITDPHTTSLKNVLMYAIEINEKKKEAPWDV